MISGINYDDDCTVGEGECSETNNVCGSGDECVCSMSTFRTIADTYVTSKY